MSGIFYGAGVGPGDPELLTVKALRVMKQCPVIAIPVSDKNFTEAAYDPTGTDPAYKRYLEKCVAYQIAVQAGARYRAESQAVSANADDERKRTASSGT